MIDPTSNMEARALELALMLDAAYLAPLVVEFAKDVAREAREAALTEAVKEIWKVRADRGQGKSTWDCGVQDAAVMCKDAVLALIPAKGAEHE